MAILLDIIKAPFTPEEVEQLNKWQQAGYVHPFTCPKEHLSDANELIATPEGWKCPDPKCGYTQHWAHNYMADPAALERADPKNLFKKF